VAYQYYQKGSLQVINGRLKEDLVVLTTTQGKKYVKLGIAVNAGDVKSESGEWVETTDWYNIVIWDNGGNSSELIKTIEKPPSDKMKFAKGNLVSLIGLLSKKLKVYEGKAQCEYTVHTFYDLLKVYTGSTANNSNSSNEDATDDDDAF
jgi:hypothetical protein